MITKKLKPMKNVFIKLLFWIFGISYRFYTLDTFRKTLWNLLYGDIQNRLKPGNELYGFCHRPIVEFIIPETSIIHSYKIAPYNTDAVFFYFKGVLFFMLSIDHIKFPDGSRVLFYRGKNIGPMSYNYENESERFWGIAFKIILIRWFELPERIQKFGKTLKYLTKAQYDNAIHRIYEVELKTR